VLSGETQVDFSGPARIATEPGQSSEAFSVAVWVRANTRTEMAVLQSLDESGAGFQLAVDEASVIPDLKRGSHVQFNLVHRQPDDAIRIQTRQCFAQGSWYHVAAVYDGSRKASGLKLYIDGAPVAVDIL